jgi:DNA-binding transcriptional regulator YiaG
VKLTPDLLLLRAYRYQKYHALMKPEEMLALRKKLNMTQQELADVLEVQRNTVTRWENGVLPITKVVELAVLSLKPKK